MTQQSNGDVDRVMAAFAAPPMAYRTFAPAPPVPVKDEGSAALVSVAARQVEGERTVAFPLLVAALPDSIQIPKLDLPSPADPVPDKAAASVPKTEPLTTRTRIVEAGQDAPTAQRPKLAPDPRRDLTTTNPAALVSLDLPFRYAAAIPSRNQPMVNGRTPLTAMFRALSATSPSRDDRTETKSGLQDLLSFL